MVAHGVYSSTHAKVRSIFRGPFRIFRGI